MAGYFVVVGTVDPLAAAAEDSPLAGSAPAKRSHSLRPAAVPVDQLVSVLAVAVGMQAGFAAVAAAY